MGRAPCCDKANVKKGPWSPEEDSKLKEYIEKHGTGGNWIALPQKAGLKRCGKSCRLRWLNYLRPNIKHGEFSDEEDRIICSLFANIGSRWSIIAAQLPGRTDNDIKNYWNTKLKKKLMGFVNPPYNNNNNNNNNNDNNNASNNYNNIISQRKLPVLHPFETSTTTSTTTSSSSSFSLSHQPLLMSPPSVPKDHYFSSYSSYGSTGTAPTSCSTRSTFSTPGLEHYQLSNMTNGWTPVSSLNFQTQDHCSLVGNNPNYTQYFSTYYPLKEKNNNLVMFGSEGSCSTSSEGSCSYQMIKQEEMGGFQNYQAYSVGNGLSYGGNNNNVGDDCNYLNFWGQKSNVGCFGETPLEDNYHVLEDLKQLISISGSSNGSNNLFNIDENKTQEKIMYF